LNYFRKRFKRFSKKKTELLVVIICAVMLALFVGVKTVRHRTPSDVKDPSLVLRAMKDANCVGDVWGLDIYLGRKNEELLSQSFPKEKTLMVGLFAETILRSAPWERSVEDLKYAFCILRQEKIRRLSEATVFLIQIKEQLRNFGEKGDVLAPKDALILKALREEEKTVSSEEMEKRYQEVLWKADSEEVKARLLVRETYLKEKLFAPGHKRKIQELKRYAKKGSLPFYLAITAREIEKGPLLQRDLLGAGRKQRQLREGEVALLEYQKALEKLAAGDAAGFVEKAETMASAYDKKDFAPVLLYQAWSVSKNDLGDFMHAQKLLEKLKKEYPVSDWAYPEKTPGYLDQKPCHWARRSRGIGKFLLPLNALRGPAKRMTAEMLSRINAISKELSPGMTRELVLDEKTFQDGLGDFFSSAVHRTLQGWQVNFYEQGVRFFLGVRIGFFDVVFLGCGDLEPGDTGTSEPMKLKLKEIRFQGIAVPRAFLLQIEEDFKKAVEQEEDPLWLVEARYWEGGAKIVFHKGPPRAASEGAGEILEAQTTRQ